MRDFLITTPTPYNAQFQFCNIELNDKKLFTFNKTESACNNDLMLSVCVETIFEKTNL